MIEKICCTACKKWVEPSLIVSFGHCTTCAHEFCRHCGTTLVEHSADGYCTNCYRFYCDPEYTTCKKCGRIYQCGFWCDRCEPSRSSPPVTKRRVETWQISLYAKRQNGFSFLMRHEFETEAIGLRWLLAHGFTITDTSGYQFSCREVMFATDVTKSLD